MPIADVQIHLRSAKLSIADVEANIAEFSAVKADAASDPANQATEARAFRYFSWATTSRAGPS